MMHIAPDYTSKILDHFEKDIVGDWFNQQRVNNFRRVFGVGATDGWPPYELSVAMQILQGIGQMIYGVFDAATDLTKLSDNPAVAKVVAVYNATLLSVIGMPLWTTSFPTERGTTYYNGWWCLLGSWMFQTFQNILDVVCAFRRGQLVKNFADQVGTILNCFTGLGAMITGCLGAAWTTGDQYVKNLGISAGFFSTAEIRDEILADIGGEILAGVGVKVLPSEH
jgi:hypothetical protein